MHDGHEESKNTDDRRQIFKTFGILRCATCRHTGIGEPDACEECPTTT